MLNCAKSLAIGNVIPITPILLAEYAACPFCPSNAAIDATFIITPLSLVVFVLMSFKLIAWAHNLNTLNVPIKFIEITLENAFNGHTFPDFESVCVCVCVFFCLKNVYVALFLEQKCVFDMKYVVFECVFIFNSVH